MELGHNLKTLRRKAGITQWELAKKSGIQVPCITRIETNLQSNPTLKTLLQLSKTLNVSLDDLVYGPRQSPQEVA